MITHNNKVYPSAGHYLTTHNGGSSFCSHYDADIEYIEKPIESPKKAPIDGYVQILPNRLMKIDVNDMSNLKQTLIHFLYTNDEQLAIILNKDRVSLDYSIFQSEMVRFSESKLIPTFTIGRPHRANFCL